MGRLSFGYLLSAYHFKLKFPSSRIESLQISIRQPVFTVSDQSLSPISMEMEIRMSCQPPGTAATCAAAVPPTHGIQREGKGAVLRVPAGGSFTQKMDGCSGDARNLCGERDQHVRSREQPLLHKPNSEKYPVL